MLALANPGSGLPALGLGVVAAILGWLGWIPLTNRLLHSSHYFEALRDGFVWGFLYSLWVTHWLSSLHPLMWMGFHPSASILAAHGIWIATSAVMGLYTALVWLAMFIVIRPALPTAEHPHPRPKIPLWMRCFIACLLYAEGLYILHLGPVGVPVGFTVYSQASLPWAPAACQALTFWAYEALMVYFGFAVSLWSESSKTTVIPGEPSETRNPLDASTLDSSFRWNDIIGLKNLTKNKGRLLRLLTPPLLPIAIGLAFPLAASPLANVPIIEMAPVPSIEEIRAPGYQGDTWLKNFEKQAWQKSPGWGLIILPEGALPDAYTPFPRIQQSVLVAGGFIHEDGHTYNGAVIRHPNGHQDLLRKRILVPFGERTPIIGDEGMQALLSPFGIEYSTGITAGRYDQPLPLVSLHPKAKNPKGSVSPVEFKLNVLICFEMFYPSLLQPDAVNIGISNLAWFHGNAQLAQQTQAAHQLFHFAN